jgi:aminoglycoside phosphotransferase
VTDEVADDSAAGVVDEGCVGVADLLHAATDTHAATRTLRATVRMRVRAIELCIWKEHIILDT